MAVALRLSRGGSKKRPFFRIVAADVRAPRDGRYLERLGTYNPMKEKSDPERVTLNKERIKYWLGQGAQPTTRVARILGENQIIEMPANGNNPKKAIPKKERNKEAGGTEVKTETKTETSPEAPKVDEKKEAPKVEAASNEPKEEEKK